MRDGRQTGFRGLRPGHDGGILSRRGYGAGFRGRAQNGAVPPHGSRIPGRRQSGGILGRQLLGFGGGFPESRNGFGSAPFRAGLVDTPAEGYAACCDALAAWDFRGRLGSVSAPTLVLVGSDDPATPPDQAQLIADGIPGARLTVLPEAAHLLNVEQAGPFNRAVLDHLTTKEAA